MRKIIILSLIILIFFLFSPFSAFCQNEKEDYIKAYEKKDPAERIQAFETYLAKYSDSEYHKDIYVLLVGDCLGVGQRAKAFEYAEKAEKLIAKLSDEQKAGIYIVLSANYFSKGNRTKASEYAEKVIELSAGKQGKTWDNLLASAKSIKAAAEVSPLKKAINLYNQKKYIEAEKEFGEQYKLNKNDFEIVKWYAKSLAKNKKTEQALEKFKEAYNLKKDGMVAYNIAITLNQKAKTNKELVVEAVKYFLEASLLLPKQSENIRKIAQGLFFNNYRDTETKLDYNSLIKRAEEINNELKKAIDEFNRQYEGKEEEEIDKDRMDADLKEIKDLQNGIERMRVKTKKAIDEFNKLLKEVEKRITKK